jgi:hypothetical protein
MRHLRWNQIHILSAGGPQPANYQPLAALAPVIIVGLTGVGKTTALNRLGAQNVPFTLLPNRRELADRVIIARLQQEAGQTPHPVTDRLARFEYTARYRARFPGGMAHALGQLAIDPAQLEPLLIFDGLRGLDEVKQAIAFFAQARFVVLDAPDTVRLQRLLQRNDAFDTANTRPVPAHQNLLAALNSISGIETVFNQAQLLRLATLAGQDQAAGEALLQKVSIIVKERRNYDSEAAGAYLRQHWPRERVLIVDTAARPAEALAEQVAAWLKD